MKPFPLTPFSFTTLDGRTQPLSDYAGKVLLIVNTASQCGFTPQYQGLEDLHRRYHARGLEIIGFPCNQFGGQEPGSAADIGAFCQKNYGVSFTMADKVDVNGDAAHPLWRWLKSQRAGFLGMRRIKWNFTKFLVDRDGRVVKRFSPTTRPEAIARHIESLL